MFVITGRNGFVGKHLANALQKNNTDFLALSREQNLITSTKPTALIHLAGRAHIMHDTASDPLAAFRLVNCDYALQVARQAVAAGIKRFVFVSSIGVNGGETFNTLYTKNSIPTPHAPYAQSKHEAELALTQLAAQTGLELVIVRPPLIYGLNAPGNFGSLLRWTRKGLPLPLGAIHNRRSLLYVKNLVDFLILCTHHPMAANETFLLSDGQDVSTTQLLQTLASAQGAPSRLLPVPSSWLRGAMRMVGKGDMAQRLLGDLQVDSSKARELLGWTPPFRFEAGIKDMFETSQ